MMENKTFTVVRSPEDTSKQYQAYLRKYENDDKLVILQAVDRPGSNPGDNYMSMLIRTKLVGTRGDGSPYAKTFMTKMIIREKKIFTLLDISDLFCTEADAYTKILPMLGSFGPSCIYADQNIIIMEDLAEKGYGTCERRNFLDLDHSVFALKRLAKLHASGLSIKINNPQQFDKFSEHLKELIYKDNSDTSVMRSCTEMCVRSIIQYLDMIKPQTQELQTIRDYFACLNKTYDVLRQLFMSSKQKYDTICHGDPWINNLLFLHDNDGKIIDLKMVDYQILRYTSLSTDVLYFIYSSVQSSLIEKSFESLIKIYHNEFINELCRLHVDEKILAELGIEWLETELRTYALYGVLVGCFLTNPILAEEKDVQQFETIDFGPMNPMYQGDINSEMSQKKIDRIKRITFHYHRRFNLGHEDKWYNLH
ncbi:PREDICTED: uncharacterized protein LOC105145097 isoform X2 [Acromyrmex echinatior]|uniref:uncharacterized protein LOC105145097 isoform X2 n=1 Tax=Acromyrmex echinatior TaxID=103372 RepID=UPI000580F6CE|nr:PREDICTED: uncharacterized protein LOC105145097 isoform X2 [Acromyrmex echinatior]